MRQLLVRLPDVHGQAAFELVTETTLVGKGLTRSFVRTELVRLHNLTYEGIADVVEAGVGCKALGRSFSTTDLPQ